MSRYLDITDMSTNWFTLYRSISQGRIPQKDFWVLYAMNSMFSLSEGTVAFATILGVFEECDDQILRARELLQQHEPLPASLSSPFDPFRDYRTFLIAQHLGPIRHDLIIEMQDPHEPLDIPDHARTWSIPQEYADTFVLHESLAVRKATFPRSVP